MDKETIVELLKLIDKESRKVSSECGLPLYDREEELLVYKVKEFFDNLEKK